MSFYASQMIPLIVKSSRTHVYVCFSFFVFMVVGASLRVVLIADLEWGPLLVGHGVVLVCC